MRLIANFIFAAFLALQIFSSNPTTATGNLSPFPAASPGVNQTTVISAALITQTRPYLITIMPYLWTSGSGCTLGPALVYTTVYFTTPYGQQSFQLTGQLSIANNAAAGLDSYQKSITTTGSTVPNQTIVALLQAGTSIDLSTVVGGTALSCTGSLPYYKINVTAQ